jgi:septum formation protein
MAMSGKKIVLASASPRRAKILSSLGLQFEVMATDAEEVSYNDDPVRTVSENAIAKANAYFREFGRDGKTLVISADTIVWFNNRIYGKPRDLEEAKEFLRELSGQTHKVFTAVAFDGKVEVVVSEVKFRNLTRSDIEDYVAKVKPVDRAGAYDIDESGSLIVESYGGSYENIMGLPIEPLVKWGIA